MHILCFRSFAVIALTVFAQSIFCAENVRAHEGWGIVVDRQGQIYFSDIPTNTIWRITREGKLEAFLSNKHSHALVLGEDGSIYGTHEHMAGAVGSVWRIAPDGSFSDVFTPARDFPLDLRPFIIDRDGNIYSGNSISFPNQSDKKTLLKAKQDGDVMIFAGGTRGYRDGQGGEAQFTGIDGMAWAADGSLYVTDGVYVRRVTLDGIVSTLGNGALTIPSYGEDLMGLSVSSSGSVYVADYSQRHLLQLMPDGNTRTILETGLLWSPTGVTNVGEDLYVLEHLRMPLVILGSIGIGPYARVRKISPDGTVERIATLWGRNTLTFTIVLLAISALFIFLWRFRRRRNMRRSHRAAAAEQVTMNPLMDGGASTKERTVNLAALDPALVRGENPKKWDGGRVMFGAGRGKVAVTERDRRGRLHEYEGGEFYVSEEGAVEGIAKALRQAVVTCRKKGVGANTLPNSFNPTPR